jgi:formylglycine-generating enzyme required for sulfatase activity
VLAVFIDDLDRCPPERIVTVLETVKLFMDKKGCVFVIGAANDIIEKALEKPYKEDAPKFMDKIVQVTFNLPQGAIDDFGKYIQQILPEVKKELTQRLNLIVPAMQANPRKIKRFLNNLNLLRGLMQNKKELSLEFDKALYWSIIDYLYPLLARDLKDRPANLKEIRQHASTLRSAIKTDERWELSEEMLKEIPQFYHAYLKDKDCVDILHNLNLSEADLKALKTFSQAVESADIAKEKAEKAKSAEGELDASVTIPAGEFQYQDGTATIEAPYAMDVYPVTNRQFGRFIQAGGYTNEAYWSEEGLKWRNAENTTQPRYWDDEKWNGPEHPVVGVSFYEAEAYARWAGQRLPTEIEWERVARGTDGRIYPWGNDFDQERCNTRESGIGKTTRVTRYPNGRSPEGCYDMAGNVWEWCDDWYDKDETYKVLRGGAWNVDRTDARCTDRLRDLPNARNDYIGFRCVRTQK